MTLQFHDTIIVNQQPYDLVGLNGGELFNPQSVGIVPGVASTACWRGYICQYKIENKHILLDELHIKIGKIEFTEEISKKYSQTAPRINGAKPKSGKKKILGCGNFYENINLQIPYTGGILAATDLISNLAVNMGFHPARKYKTVIEIVLENGQVQEIRDLSNEMAALRKIRRKEIATVPGTQSKDYLLSPTQSKEPRKRIEKLFSLDYDK